LKNIQIIEPAANCKYEIYAASDEEFDLIFPNGADIEFIEDCLRRLGNGRLIEITNNLWTRPINKPEVQGIHGTLFYQMRKIKKGYYPNKRFSDDEN
jgi:hypothetical protein